jgi:hypothetical protein
LKIRTRYSPLALFAWQRDDALGALEMRGKERALELHVLEAGG